ncbi:MAG TPA: hypothetical protein VEO19_08215 [Terriglobia bacterium]|nr:hypothetical protein [Terriglobia bacterium]
MPKFNVGDILLCFSRYPVKGAGAEILLLEVVDKVGSRFYSLAARTYKYRESFANLESRAIRLPPDFPWRFPEDFCAFRYLLPIAYRSTTVSVYEVGVPYGRKFEKVMSELTGETYQDPTELGFVVRGYAVREAKSGSEECWFWLNTRWDVLVKFKETFGRAEESLVPSDDDLPECLQEQGRKRWDAAPIALGRAISKPGDFFCEGSIRSGFSFYAFDGLTKLGKIKTIQYRPPAEAKPVSLPTAFPPPILARLRNIYRYDIFDETILWVAHERWPSSGATNSAQIPTDLPGGASTVVAFGRLFENRTAIYYSNDLTRWWRRLSKALECELDRLRFIYPTGVPAVQ